MKFGGLSEEEVEKISKILGQDGVPFGVSQDEAIQSFNTQSIRNDLRHYSPPNISTHCLAIEVEDEDFHRLSKPSRDSLLEFGITDQAPAAADFVPHAGKNIYEELARDTNRVVAMNFKHQLMLVALATLAFWIFKEKFL